MRVILRVGSLRPKDKGVAFRKSSGAKVDGSSVRKGKRKLSSRESRQGSVVCESIVESDHKPEPLRGGVIYYLYAPATGGSVDYRAPSLSLDPDAIFALLGCTRRRGKTHNVRDRVYQISLHSSRRSVRISIAQKTVQYLLMTTLTMGRASRKILLFKPFCVGTCLGRSLIKQIWSQS